MESERKYEKFWDFYNFYLTEHQNPTSQTLHFIGTFIFLVILFTAFATQKWAILFACPLVGYGFAWTGHFFFEKNKPATFKYPLFSLASDFVMFFHILTGQLSKKVQIAKREIGV